MTISSILLVLALVCFVVAAMPVSTKFPISLVPAGLACWVLAQILGAGIL